MLDLRCLTQCSKVVFDCKLKSLTLRLPGLTGCVQVCRHFARYVPASIKIRITVRSLHRAAQCSRVCPVASRNAV